MAYSVTFSQLASLLNSLSANTENNPYEITITSITQEQLQGNLTPQAGTLQYVLQRYPNKFVSITLPSLSWSFMDRRYMFRGCDTLVYLYWTSQVFDDGSGSDSMFENCTHLKYTDTNVYSNTYYYTMLSCSKMFKNCYQLECFDMLQFDTGITSSSNEMFSGCSNLKYLWNFPGNTNILTANFFYNAVNIKAIYTSTESNARNLAIKARQSGTSIWGSNYTAGTHKFYASGSGLPLVLSTTATKDNSTGIITVSNSEIENMIAYDEFHDDELGLSGHAKIHEISISYNSWGINSHYNDTLSYYLDDNTSNPTQGTLSFSPDYSPTVLSSSVTLDVDVSNSSIYKLPDISNTRIEAFTAENCSQLVDYPPVFPSTCTVFERAFKNCTNLPENITISAPSANHCEWMFQNCTQIKSVQINTATYTEYMFDGCTSLKTVNFTASGVGNVLFQDGHAFDNASALETVYIEDSPIGTGIFVFTKQDVVLKFNNAANASLSAMRVNAYLTFGVPRNDVKCYYCPNIGSNFTKPDSVSKDSNTGVITVNHADINAMAQWNDWNEDPLGMWSSTAANPVKINDTNISGTSWTNELKNVPTSSTYGYYISDSSSNPTHVQCSDNARYAGMYVDYSPTQLPASIVSISDANDTHIKATPLLAPYPVTISQFNFSGCTGLTSVSAAQNASYKIPNMNGSFKGCTSLASWGSDKAGITAYTTSTDETFSGCTALASVDFPANTTSCEEMFKGCTSLTSVNLKQKTDITEASSMFEGCTGLISIYGFKLSTSITKDDMLKGCTSLANIYISAPASALTQDWQLVRVSGLTSSSVKVRVYDTNGANDTPHQVGSDITLTGADTVRLLNYTDEILFAATNKVTNEVLNDSLEWKYEFGPVGGGISPKNSNFILWAKDPTKFISNIDFSSTRFEYSSGAGLCESVGSASIKSVDILNYTLTAGNNFVITFSNDNTYSGLIKLNVGNTGAKSLYLNGTVSSSTNHTLPAGSYNVTYDGTNYYIETTHSVASARTAAEAIHASLADNALSANNIIAYCNTSASTAAKTATLENFRLKDGQRILLYVSNTNSSSSKLTLNVNSTGAKDVYVNNSIVQGSSGVDVFARGLYQAIYSFSSEKGYYWNLIPIIYTSIGTTCDSRDYNGALAVKEWKINGSSNFIWFVNGLLIQWGWWSDLPEPSGDHNTLYNCNFATAFSNTNYTFYMSRTFWTQNDTAIFAGDNNLSVNGGARDCKQLNYVKIIGWHNPVYYLAIGYKAV